jgi:hypothetical protein
VPSADADQGRELHLEIFNNDGTLAATLLDRLLHYAETVLMEGKAIG